jgi:hypothetical protein
MNLPLRPGDEPQKTQIDLISAIWKMWRRAGAASS